MVRTTDRQTSVLRAIDWWTVAIYIALLIFGWVSVCGASYTYGDTDIFSLSTRSGMQIVWIGTSLFLGLVLLLLDDRFYDTFAYVIYAALLLLLFLTIFNPHEIKGSRFVARFRSFALATCRICKVCHGLSHSKTHGRI